MSKALVLIDLQNDYFPGGRMELVGADAAVEQAAALTRSVPPALRGPGVSQIVFAGMTTHRCVDTTVRAASDLGFACALAQDACATRNLQIGSTHVASEDVQSAFMAALNGAFASVRSAAELAAQA